MKRQSTFIFIVIAIMICLVAVNIILFRQYISRIEDDASTLNSLGIIRGSIQRFSKLELSNIENEDIRAQINNKLHEYQEVPFVDKVDEKWEILEEMASAYRTDPSEENRKKLLELSEECWEIADQAVFKNQIIAENKSAYLTLPIIFLVMDLFVGIMLLFIIKKYVYNSLERFALYDLLTKAYNRRYFLDAMNREILKAGRKETSFSLIMFDIDYFKNVNDNYGHSVGDDVLKGVVSIAQSTIRKTDILSRIGGEEFTIILPEFSSDQASIIAERLRKNTEEHSFEHVGKITVSLGVASYNLGDTYDELLKKADSAMYKAKNGGRNRVEIYS